MATDVSLEIEIKDNYSVVMDKIAKATRMLKGDINDMQGSLDKLNKTKATLQIDVQSAKQRLSEARKGFVETSKAINDTRAKLEQAEMKFHELNTESARKEVEELRAKLQELNSSSAATELRDAQENYNNLASSLSAVTSKAKDAERAMRSLNGVTNQSSAINGTGTNASGSAINSAAIMNIMRTGISFTAGILSTDLNSSGNYEAATMLDDIVSGALSGAAMGSMGGFGVGTAIGAVVGGITGTIKGITDVNASELDYLAGVTESQFNSTTGAVDEWLTQGSAIQAQRTTDNIAFAKILGGKDIADDYLSKIVTKANYTPFLYSDLTSLSKSLAVYGYNPDEMLDMLDKIGDTGAALGLDASGMSDIAAYLGRMKISGTTSNRYLQPLIAKGIKVYDYLGESLGVSAERAKEMVSQGLIPGAEAAKVIADYMGHDYAGSMKEISTTYNGLTSTVQGWEQEMQNAMGEGYNKAKIPMLEQQIAWFEQNGEKMKDVYRKVGETNAEAENEGTLAKLKAWDDIIANIDNYSGGKLRAKLAEAENAEYVAYLKSDGYSEMYMAEKELIDRLGTDLASVWTMTGYEHGKQYLEGAKAGIRSSGYDEALAAEQAKYHVPNNWDEGWHYHEGYEAYIYSWGDGSYSDPYPVGIYTNMAGTDTLPPESERHYPEHAFGFSYVPYDDYPAMLHQGERVLTASQNREYSQGSASGVTVIMNGVTVREDADIDRIADELHFRIRVAAANYSDIE